VTVGSNPPTDVSRAESSEAINEAESEIAVLLDRQEAKGKAIAAPAYIGHLYLSPR
jgi:hypothetical protein